MPTAAKPSAAWPPVTSYVVPLPLGVQFAGCEGAVVEAVSNDGLATLLPLTKKVPAPALFVSSDSRMVLSGSTVTRTECVPGLPCERHWMLTLADPPADSDVMDLSGVCTTPSTANRTPMLDAAR